MGTGVDVSSALTIAPGTFQTSRANAIARFRHQGFVRNSAPCLTVTARQRTDESGLFASRREILRTTVDGDCRATRDSKHFLVYTSSDLRCLFDMRKPSTSPSGS